MSRLFWLAGLVTLTACGTPRPATLSEQRAAVGTADPARAGWWAYLDGDAAAARAAFERAPEDPLAVLGRVRLAIDALDAVAAYDAAVYAADRGDGRVKLLGQRWALDADADLPDGERPALPTERAPLTGARHTVRISFLPHLARAALRDHPPRMQGDKVRALGAWWALSTDRPAADRDGLILTRLPLDAGPTHIELRVGGPVLAWRAGQLVAATPADRLAAEHLRFTADGDGPLWVAWAAERPLRAWRWSSPAPPPPALDDGPPVPDRAPTADRLALYLAVEQALADRDPAEAARLLATAPLSPAFAAQRARTIELEAAAGARDRARAAWTDALPLAPARARVALSRLARRAGDADEALAHADAALALAPSAWPAHRARIRALTALGWVEDARAAIDAAEVCAPGGCAPNPCLLLDDRIALGGLDPDDVVARLDACDRALDAAEHLLTAKRPEAALDRLTRLDLDTARARRLEARALVGLGRLDDARDRLAPGDALPDDLDDHLTAIDLARPEDPPALTDALRALVAAHPTAREALITIAADPQTSPFAPLHLDTDAVITAYEATVPLPGPAVRVLDHSALLYFQDGQRLRWVHEVLAIRSREAAEVYGELTLPGSDVIPVALYTRKADGRRLYAVEEPAKDALSLPDLEVGDYVVAVYLEPGDNGYLYDSGFLTPRVYFRGVDMPIYRQRLDVYAPDATPPDHQALLGAPAPTPVTLGDRAGLRFDATATPVLPPEQEPVPPGLWLDSVRSGRGVALRDDLDYYRDRVLAHRRRTGAFDDWARAHAGEGPRAEQIRRLTRAVRADVDGDSGLIRRSVTDAPQSGRGNRALVLSAALEALAIPHRLLMARPQSHVPAGPFLQVADFPYPLIALDDGTWIDPGPDRAAIGWLPHLMLGGDALHIWPPTGPIGPTPLPTTRAVTDRRDVRVTAHWGKDGVIRGQITDTLTGQEASVIGGYLDRLDPDQRPRLVERLLTHAFPTGRVIALEDPTLAPPDAPLVMRYTFEADAGDRLRLGAFPVQPGRRYAVEPERQIPLSIDLPTRQRVHIEITSDRPFQLAARPGAVTQDDARYRLTVDHDDTTLTLDAALDIPAGVVAPDAYPAFAPWARSVDPRERLTLTITTPDS